jgi:membrane protein
MLKGANSSAGGGLSAVIGIRLPLVAALGVVVQLKDALNTIFEVKEPLDAGIGWYARVYVISAAGILALGFMLAVSLVISTVLAVFSSWLGGSAVTGLLFELSQPCNFACPCSPHPMASRAGNGAALQSREGGYLLVHRHAGP